MIVRDDLELRQSAKLVHKPAALSGNVVCVWGGGGLCLCVCVSVSVCLCLYVVESVDEWVGVSRCMSVYLSLSMYDPPPPTHTHRWTPLSSSPADDDAASSA